MLSLAVAGAAALVADVQLAADPHDAARGVAHRPALPEGAGRRVDGEDAVLAVHRGVHGGAVSREHRLGRQRALGAVLGDGDERRRTHRTVGVDREPGVAVGLRYPQRRAVRRVRRPLLPHVVAADLEVGRRGVPDQLLHCPVLQVHDGQRDTAIRGQGGEVATVRADGIGHDLAVVDDQSVTDRA